MHTKPPERDRDVFPFRNRPPNPEILALRVMYWPNEPAHLLPVFAQAGGRAAFSAMEEDGMIDALAIYSYRVERAQYHDNESFEQAARDAVRTFEPDILFVQHVAGTGISEEFWLRLRDDLPHLTIAYHEGDVFSRWIKRLDPTTIGALRHSQVVFACGLGSIIPLYRKYTSAPIWHLPHCFTSATFGRHDPAKAPKAAHITMIGNRGRLRRLPLLHFPGGRRRANFAARLTHAFGKDFALYGRGWDHLIAARGLLPFAEQESAIQAARISANWDHFDKIGWYFSDRLPISLAAGVPHVTSWHEGYDEMFADCPGLYPCRTPDEAIDTCHTLLGRSDRQLLEEGMAGREWAWANLEANGVFRRGMEQAIALHKMRAGR